MEGKVYDFQCEKAIFYSETAQRFDHVIKCDFCMHYLTMHCDLLIVIFILICCITPSSTVAKQRNLA